MKEWTIRQRILGSFAFIIALMIVMGALVINVFANIEKATNNVETDSLIGLQHSTDILLITLDNQILVQYHVISTDRRAMQKIEEQIRSNRARVTDLLKKYETTIYHTEERQLFEMVNKTRGPYLALQDRVLQLSLALRNEEAYRLTQNELDPEFEKFHVATLALKKYNEENNLQSIKEIENELRVSRISVISCITVALLLSVLFGHWLFRAINRPLVQLVNALNVMRQGDFTERMKLERKDEFGTVAEGFNRMIDELAALVGQVQKSGLQVTTSVTEVSATAKQQQATAKEIAATTAEIGATSKEISATSKELVKTMNEVSTVAEKTASLAGSGQSGLSHMGDTMHHVMEAAGSITSKLAVLNEKASNITQVVTTITKVADQTNLLSLNAAIEAEKAGEHGRGFAVVATEIRRLADQTAVATYDIEQTVKEIQSAVSASVMGMDKFSEEVRRGMQDIQQISGQLSEIIQQVQALAPRVEAVNEGMQAQATGAEQITQALTQLNEAAQQTVESLQQSTVAIDGLNQVANGLRGGVSRFKLLPA